jgi:hypothetical protein
MNTNAINANNRQRLCKKQTTLLWKPAKSVEANSRKRFPIPLSIFMEMAFIPPTTNANT